MKKLILCILILISLFFSINIPFTSCENIKYKTKDIVSIINLIGTPENFHDKLVVICGVLKISENNTAIYLSKDDYNNNIAKNAIWIKSDAIEKYRKYNNKYVIIEGVFDMNVLGYKKLFAGTLKEIQRITEWDWDWE